MTILVFGASVVCPSTMRAQSCYGTPSRSNVAYEYGTVTFGRFDGVSAHLVGTRTALSIGGRFGEIEDVSVQEGSLRFGVQLPAGKLQVCPALGLGFSRATSEPEPEWNLASNTLSLRAGIGVGIEQEVYRGVALIPFVAARYEFNVLYIRIDAPNADVTQSGDTSSTVDFEYGLMASWKVLYAGVAAQRNKDSGDRPYFARYVVGLTFGNTRKR